MGFQVKTQYMGTYREKALGLKIQRVGVDEDLEPLWGHLQDHLSKSGILSLAQGGVLWPSTRVILASRLGSRTEGGCLPNPLGPLVF